MTPSFPKTWKKLAVLLLLGFLSYRLYQHVRPPSEAGMLTTFRQHKPELEKLVAMMKRDESVRVIGPGYVHANYTRVPDGVDMTEVPLQVSEARISEYRQIMDKLEIGAIIRDHRGKNPQQDRFRFAAFGGGFGGSTWSIGYAWCPSPPKKLGKSIFTGPQNDYAPIEGYWYFYRIR
jgi:hypothetical protein